MTYCEKPLFEGMTQPKYRKYIMMKYNTNAVFFNKMPCNMWEAVDIQCRVKGSGLNHSETGDDIRHCDATLGLLCINRNDTHDVCSDYEVRYKCPLHRTGGCNNTVGIVCVCGRGSGGVGCGC